jgi:SAM-dependent methyltransferase
MTMSVPLFLTEESCRCCKGANLEKILHFGNVPLADRLIPNGGGSEYDIHIPLTLEWCADCSLLQIKESVRPEILYQQQYPYYSSVSKSYLHHARCYSENILMRKGLCSDNLVVEVACNDGYLLKNFQQQNIPVLGIDPAEGPAKVARQKGIEVVIDFFDRKLALHLASSGKMADVIIANNVLAHVADPNNLIAAFAHLLKDDGLLCIEVPWVVELLENLQFDTIYHQHHCYFSLHNLRLLLHRHGLYINEVEHYCVQGGSLRIYAGRQEKGYVDSFGLARREADLKLRESNSYFDFAEATNTLRRALRATIDDLWVQGRTVAGYGAAAKAATLLHFCGIGADRLEWIADRNRFKHGCRMGGTHIPIVPLETILQERPDYLLLLSWNLAKEILQQQCAYREAGGRFIIPIPWPRVL